MIEFVKKFIGEDVYVRTECVKVKNNGQKFSGCITNVECTGKYFIKQSSGDDFSIKGTVESESGKYLIVGYSQTENEQDVFSCILKALGKGDEICYYIKNFINTGSARTLPSEIFDRLLKRKKTDYYYPFMVENYEDSKLPVDLCKDDLYDILSSDMSYDDHCPICNQIPTLNVLDGTLDRIERWEKRNCLIAMLPAKFENKRIFVKILCCKSCLEEYKNSLSEAEIEDGDTSYRTLILTSRIVTTNRSDDIVNRVSISPDNWCVIEHFNGLDCIQDY